MKNNLNIVIPMAGNGSRFVEAGYDLPKPFIDVNGKMMIERVLDNLYFEDARFILIARSEHVKNFSQLIEKIKCNYNVEMLTVDALTDGAACTCLKAHRFINNETPLLFANSDQIVDMPVVDFINDAKNKNADGSILTFRSDSPKWSYARLSESGQVVEVREKKPISNHATVGLYYFSEGKTFINGTLDMIANADKTNGEYYVAPVYNYCIKNDKKIIIREIEEGQMHGIGTPQDLKTYLKLLEEKN